MKIWDSVYISYTLLTRHLMCVCRKLEFKIYGIKKGKKTIGHENVTKYVENFEKFHWLASQFKN